MRSWHLVLTLLLVLLGGTIFVLMRGDDAAAPPTPPSASNPRGASPNDAPPAVGERLPATPPTTAPPSPAPTPPSDAPTTPQPPAAPPGNLLLVVRDAATLQPVPTFRWRFRGDGDPLRGVATDGRAELLVPVDVPGELLVEADQRQPFRQAAVRGAAPGEPPTQLEITLVPIVTNAGITLHVHDLGLQAMTQVRVDAFKVNDGNRAAAWHLEPSLWARRATSTDGRYQLPTLPAGEYGIRLVALDEAGNLLPLLPYLRTFTLTGDNGFVEDVPLEPGCALSLELVDAHGAPFNPTVYGTATIGLRLPGGPPVQRKWFSRQGDTEATAVDVLPAIGTASLAQAVPAGTYTLEIFANGEPRVSQSLQLRAGERQVERIVVP